MRNYQVIPPNPIGVFPGKASHIKSGSSIGAVSLYLAIPDNAIAKDSEPGQTRTMQPDLISGGRSQS
ncbi:hypothetical protein [Microcoleus asticus]|uniref:hypothetical protein n=1 Tax=Microcoleus asticus TaxID=2815231 RepID=UPI001553792C|nr:hypothetical protein [Microcoleus asticus]